MDYRLMLNRDEVDRCRKLAREIATHLLRYTSRHTSTGVERATLRAMGVEGDWKGTPLTTCVVDTLGKERLRDGAAYWLGAVMVAEKSNALEAARLIAQKGLPKKSSAKRPHAEIRKVTRAAFAPFLKEMERAEKARRSRARQFRQRWGSGDVICGISTGHVDRDVKAVQELAEKRAVAGVVITPPFPGDNESLVGKGAGWRGKYNILSVIDQCDTWQEKARQQKGKPLEVLWGGEGLTSPEVVIRLSTSSLAGLEYDCFTLAQCEGVHFKRAIVDQEFIFQISARAGLSITVPSDRWYPRADAYAHGHELIMGQVIIEGIASLAGMALEDVGSRHGLIMGDRGAERDALLYELAHAQLVRELFPQVELAFRLAEESKDQKLGVGIASLCGHSALYALMPKKGKAAGTWYDQLHHDVHPLYSLLSGVCHELQFAHHGKISRRTHMILERAMKGLQQMHRRDFLKLVSSGRQGLFAIPEKGAGLDGVVQKGRFYWSPVMD
jgi:beta-lysine 5,6-aminomutase alpha subunit